MRKSTAACARRSSPHKLDSKKITFQDEEP
jgi:hypothetical protein